MDMFAGLVDEVAVTEVIRPAAVLSAVAAHRVVLGLSAQDVRAGGLWCSTPVQWQRYDRPWVGGRAAGVAQLLGTLEVIYGAPTRHEITVYRACLTVFGCGQGWTVRALCDEALGHAGLTLDSCPRAELAAPPAAFRFRG